MTKFNIWPRHFERPLEETGNAGGQNGRCAEKNGFNDRPNSLRKAKCKSTSEARRLFTFLFRSSTGSISFVRISSLAPSSLHRSDQLERVPFSHKDDLINCEDRDSMTLKKSGPGPPAGHTHTHTHAEYLVLCLRAEPKKRKSMQAASNRMTFRILFIDQ